MKAQAPTIIGESAALAQALDHISKLAAIDRPTLIIGERGTGKELAAERLHFLSPRWDQTFTKINCSAVTETLLESELFGHEAGAFTGANKQHIGRFELTDSGTLFLDELATMSPRLQEKLLRVIEYGEFERVGGIDPLRTRVHCTRCDRRARHKAQVPLQVCIGGVFGNARYLVAADELRIGQSCAADQPQAGCQIAVDRELDALVRLIPEVSEAAVGKHTLSRSLKAVGAETDEDIAQCQLASNLVLQRLAGREHLSRIADERRIEGRCRTLLERLDPVAI